MINKQIIMLYYIKKTEKTPSKELDIAIKRMKKIKKPPGISRWFLFNFY
jgi:phage-related protein